MLVILQVNLIAEGFGDAKEIGKKLVIVFSFAKEVLFFPNQEYDPLAYPTQNKEENCP